MTTCKCGKTPEPGYKTCRPCIDKSVRYAKSHPEVAPRARYSRAERFRKAGLCHCGAKPQEGKKTCSRCLNRTREFARRRVADHATKGLCTYCGQTASLEGIKLCLRCKLVSVERTSRGRFKASEVSAEQVMALWEKQEGRCAVTGVQMSLTGLGPTSVSLDHVEAGHHVVENLQWVCWRVNQMKGNMSLADFLYVLGPEGVARLSQVLEQGQQSSV